MNENDIHELILKHVCKEISAIADSINKNGGITSNDMEKLDKLYHIKKDMLTCKAMTDSEYEGVSEMRGRSPATGRYVSRNSYDDGYSRGYAEAMNQNNGNSGHWPMQGPYYPEPRRW